MKSESRGGGTEEVRKRRMERREEEWRKEKKEGRQTVKGRGTAITKMMLTF